MKVEKLRGVTKGMSEDREAIALAGRLTRACPQDVGPAGAMPLDAMGLYAPSPSSKPRAPAGDGLLLLCGPSSLKRVT